MEDGKSEVGVILQNAPANGLRSVVGHYPHLQGSFGYKTAKHTFRRFDFDLFCGGGGLFPVTDIDYLGRSLNQRSYDLGKKTIEALEVAMRQQNARNMLASGSTLLLFQKTALESLTEGFREAGSFTFNLTETNQRPALEALKFFAKRITDMLSDDLTQRCTRLGLDQPTVAPWLNNTKIELQERRERLIDDFQHGMHGNERMKKDPVISVVQNQSSSPGGVQQVGFGNFSQTAMMQTIQPLLDAIARAQKSDEFKALDPDKQVAFRDVADALVDETKKNPPEPGKIKRWGERLLGLCKELGLRVATGEIQHLLQKIFPG